MGTIGGASYDSCRHRCTQSVLFAYLKILSCFFWGVSADLLLVVTVTCTINTTAVVCLALYYCGAIGVASPAGTHAYSHQEQNDV